MHRLCFVIVLLIFISCLASCGAVDQSLELAVCGSYGVPGMMCSDLKGGTFSCDIKETDSFGRILFAYETYNQIEQQLCTFLVICQHIDGNNVFYYEDICFIRNTEDMQAMESLKTENDWEKPLDYSKMATRPKTISFDLVLQTNTKTEIKIIKKEFCQLAGILENDITGSFLIDANSSGQTLDVFCVNRDGTMEQYLVMCDLDYQINWTKLQAHTEYEKEMILFKQENGWFYRK